jgi:hypothetical protein
MSSNLLLKHDVANIIATSVQKMIEPVDNIILTIVSDTPYDEVHHVFGYNRATDTIEELLNTTDNDEFDEYELDYTLTYQKKQNGVYVFRHDSAYGERYYLIDFKKKICEILVTGNLGDDYVKVSVSFRDTKCG